MNMPAPPLPSSDLLDCAAALLGTPVELADLAGQGANSRVYKIRAGDAEHALKLYRPPTPQDPRDRLGIEVAALGFLRANGVAGAPAALAWDAGRNLAILEWIDGAVVSGRPGATDIADACRFLTDVAALASAPGAADIAVAPQACLSIGEIVHQIHDRRDRLEEQAARHPSLCAFLREFDLEGGHLLRRSLDWAADAGQSVDQPLPPAARALFPADFGFHNVLRSARGLRFIDFEYFGWDDPVKLAADIQLHPGMDLDDGQRQVFIDCIAQWTESKFFRARYRICLPLFGLRWVMILLNIFLPHRRADKAAAAELEALHAVQLAKARTLLSRLIRT